MVQNLLMTEVSSPLQRGPFSWASRLKKAAGAWVVKGQEELGEMPVSLVHLQPLFLFCRLCYWTALNSILWCNWMKINGTAESRQLWKETYHNCIFKVLFFFYYLLQKWWLLHHNFYIALWIFDKKHNFMIYENPYFFPPRISQKTNYTSVHVIFFKQHPKYPLDLKTSSKCHLNIVPF